MNTKALRQKVLDLAIHGKLVPQNPNDESATVLLEKIRAEKAEKIKKGELKTDKKDSFIFTKECEFDEDKLGKCSSGTRHKRHYEQFADGTVKDIEDEIPFEVPEGWAWCRLHSISVLLNGDRGENYPSKNDYVEQGIPFINAGCLDNGFIDFSLANYITEEKYNSLRAGKIQEGDILYCLRGSLGKTGIVINNSRGAISSSLCIFRLNKVIQPEFFLHVLNSSIIFNQQNLVDNGTAQPNLSAKDVSNYFIPLPSISEQQIIISAIEKLFEQIDTLEENKADLQNIIKQTKSKILDLAIHGKLVPQDTNDEPAEELLKRIATSDNRPYKKLSGDEIPFELPKTWIWQKLPDLCSIPITDGTHKTPTYSDKENGIPFLSSKDVTSGEIDWSKIKYITKELHEELYKRLAPQKNDILLAKNGTTGIAALVKDNTVFDIYVTLALIRPISKIIYPQYLLYIINSQFCKNQFNDHLTGIGVPNLHLVDINKTVIPLPPLYEQQRIVLKIEELFKYTDIININIKDC